MYEWSKSVMDDIINKRDIPLSTLMVIERLLRLHDIEEDIMNYQIKSEQNNTYDMTFTIEDNKKVREIYGIFQSKT